MRGGRGRLTISKRRKVAVGEKAALLSFFLSRQWIRSLAQLSSAQVPFNFALKNHHEARLLGFLVCKKRGGIKEPPFRSQGLKGAQC